MTTHTILSYGMGVESTAILLRWIEEPETRPCPLDELLVITSQTGDEYEDTGRDVTAHVLPRLRDHGIRFVEVARAGSKQAAGITVLQDTRSPERIHLEGSYKLSTELKTSGVVPNFAGEHRCSLKFKAFVIEAWLEENVRVPARHAFGYNADEKSRVAKSEAAFAERFKERIAFGFNADEMPRVNKAKAYDTPTRTGFYPLVEWGWTRQDCIEYIAKATGIIWQKSACVYCPFNALGCDAQERHAAHPRQVADALALEQMSLALNPRGQLYRKESLIAITLASGKTEALAIHQANLEATDWALYRVRRIYTRKGKADRAVEQLGGPRTQAAAHAAFDLFARELKAEVEVKHGIRYAYRVRRTPDAYPAREEFFVAAPAYVATKTRYGIEHFEKAWKIKA